MSLLILFLMNDEIAVIGEVISFVKQAMREHESGHGWSHIERVVRLALHIRESEGRGERLTIELGALLHDVAIISSGLTTGLQRYEGCWNALA